MDENMLKFLKIGSIVGVAILGLFSFATGSFLLGLVSFFVLGTFFWSYYNQSKQEDQEFLELHEMIDKSIDYLETYFKHSVGTGDSFKLYGHRPFGETEYRLIFYIKDDQGETFYFPITIDRVTGVFGEQTGTKTNAVVDAEHFLNRKTVVPSSAPTFGYDDVKTLLEQQEQKFNEELEEKVAQVRGDTK